jgi:hypothetical protein
MLQPVLAQRLFPNDSGNAGLDWEGAMRAGDFAPAWSISDAVLAARDPATRDDSAQPYHRRWVWDGRRLDDRRVLVRCYHGLGDPLQFARYLAPLRGMADAVRPFGPALPLPASDVEIEIEIEIMELAHALRHPPDAAPYLSAMPSAVGVGRVGLCW